MKLNSTQSLALVKAVIKTKPRSTKNVMAMVIHFINSGELPPHIEETKIPSWVKVEEFASQLITAALNWEADKKLAVQIVSAKIDYLDAECHPKHGGPTTDDYDAWWSVQNLLTPCNGVKLFDPKKIKDEIDFLTSVGYAPTEEDGWYKPETGGWCKPVEDLIDTESPIDYDNQ